MARNLPKPLRKAPLVYVLAQVRISPILAMEANLPQIQEALRHMGYPGFNEVTRQGMRLGFALPGPQASQILTKEVKDWHFTNKDQNTGIVLTSGYVVFHTTAYEMFDRFIEKFQRGLEIIHDVAKINLVERIGLRYIDVIEPEEGDTLDQYLDSGLAGFPTANGAIRDTQTLTESIANTDYGQIIARCHQRRDDTLIPADLQPLRLKLARKRKPGDLSALLDIDHFCDFSEQSMDFSVEEVVSRLCGLHDITSLAFKATVTDHAIARWR